MAPVIGGTSAGILGGLSFGSLLAPLGLGLGGLMLMMGMNGRQDGGNVEYIDMPQMPMISQPMQPMLSPPYAPSFGYTMLPAPIVVPIIEEPVPVKKRYGKSYGQSGSGYGHRTGYGNGYGNRGTNDRASFVNPGYGYNQVQYQRTYKPTSYGSSRPNRGDEQFFQLPTNHAFTRIMYDEEPEVNKVKTKETIQQQPHKIDISAYSKKCPISQQTCSPRYGANEPTVYGAVDIVSMICELHCSARKPNCPEEMCSCTCNEEPADDISLQARISAASLFGK